MYLDYYGFTEKPFTITPNPRFIFFSKIHKEAFALLLYGINNRFGFMELTGEVGTGKTTVLRTLLNQLGDDAYRIALIFNPSLSAVELMRAINQEYGIPDNSGHVAGLLGELNSFLLRENAAGRTVVLVIDEAQNLAPAVLEQIRLISNLETESEKLIQIVLAGQPELGRLLSKPELRQIDQRIALRYHLRPLDREDSRAYIEHRLEIAGGRGKVEFSSSAISAIYRYSRGTPRLMNMLCDRALLIGYTKDSRKITGRDAALAFRDIMLKRAGSVSPLVLWGSTLVVLLLGIVFSYPALTGLKSGGTTVVKAAPVMAGNGGISPPPVEQFDPVKFKQAVLDELSVRSEEKSAVQAINALAPLWNVSPVKRLGPTMPVAEEIRRQARQRNLELLPFGDSLDLLLRLDSPALLAIAARDGKGSFLVALTGTRNGKLLISPSLLGRTAFSRGELQAIWSGRAYIVWRNHEKIPLAMRRGAQGPKVKKLQALLRLTGSQDLRPTGIYDEATVTAVKGFQASRGIKETGTVGPVTLIHLYHVSKNSTTTPGPYQTGKQGRS